MCFALLYLGIEFSMNAIDNVILCWCFVYILFIIFVYFHLRKRVGLKKKINTKQEELVLIFVYLVLFWKASLYGAAFFRSTVY